MDFSGAGVMPNMSHCQITRSTRFARHVRIIKPNPNPTTNPNPKILTLNQTVTEEINIGCVAQWAERRSMADELPWLTLDP